MYGSIRMMHKLAFVSILLVFTVGSGIAQDSTPGIVIANASWVDEWVEITNQGQIAQNFTGWNLLDEQNHTYIFPDAFILAPGESVMVHTETGDDSATDLYMNRERAIWNNEGDVATLRDEMGKMVDKYPK